MHKIFVFYNIALWIALHSLWYHHTYRCDDTRGSVMQLWPPDVEHMCSKHVEVWNKFIVKQKFCASSWLITEINICCIYTYVVNQHMHTYKNMLFHTLKIIYMFRSLWRLSSGCFTRIPVKYSNCPNCTIKITMLHDFNCAVWGTNAFCNVQIIQLFIFFQKPF